MGRNRSEFTSPTSKELAALPREQSRALAMFCAGDTYDLISDMTGWPMGTVKSRLSRARRAVKIMRAENPDDAQPALENGDSR